ncbi:ion channel protein Tsx [Shewanella inventionis]|uniref:Ion channel protein Tsx n=1 Tax=Shewanella inventionis TaxID=1738770 RepID=A0ABQ1IN83_9GAMM|nr:outer membrane protein OmpK [Shewanella inventionis]MCL1156570.1 ion channel protein Tsx [Shewanella inventionis]UAL44263.1 ion channel protein Tsx [Shewanella inventionis]GGB46546.1 ion channel protein Tsx [Shewanella inventionis]
MKKICILASLAIAPNVLASDLIQWWDASATVLHGTNYDLAPSERQTTITLETAGGWTYGDWFVFQDFINFNGNNGGENNTTYGEISPRFSASKILGQSVGFGKVSDVSLALTYEQGEGPVESMLYGVGLDFDVPFFTYLQLNTYRRNAISNGNISDGWQFTPVFRIDMPVGKANIIIDGFIDWVFIADNNGYDENLHFNPQIKYDLGQSLFGEHKKNTLLVGFEYDYWQSKYGVNGVDQNTYSIIAQYHF